MEVNRFDMVTRRFGSRRQALGAALSGATLLGLSEMARAKKKRKGKNKKTCKTPSGKCLCAFGEMCLANGGCGQFCNAQTPCPAGCTCGEGIEDTTCLQDGIDCQGLPLCATTADCLPGSVCRATACLMAQCVPLCTA